MGDAGFMVPAMVYDRAWGYRVAWLVGIAACGPTVKPASVGDGPGPISQAQKQRRVDPTSRRVVVGEMCPQGAGGRPAVAPLLMRNVSWNDNASEVAAAVERGTVPRFFIYGVDGKVAGTFDTLGIAEVGIGQSVATGTYVGASPCTYGVTPRPGEQPRAEDPSCGPVTKGCGIAIGDITTAEETPSKASFTTGGACVSGSDLAVDIDGDGKIESFPIAAVLDGIRGPASEWSATPTATASCKPSFQVYNLKIAPPPRPNKKDQDKGTVIVDVLAVIDLDGDGRKELVLAMRFPTTRSIVVYSASAQAQRLELAGEGTSILR